MEEELRKLTRVETMLNEPNFANWDVVQIEERLERVTATFGQYEAQHRIVLNGTTEQNRKMGLQADYEKTEDLYVKIKSCLKKRLGELAPPPALVAAAPPAAAPIVQVQVEKETAHTWGYFSGDYLQWKDFRSRFVLAVHDMETLSDGKKMSFLRNSLKGPAAEAMEGYGLEPAKYKEFWDALNAKYDQKFTLANHYLANFFKLPKMDWQAGAPELSRLSNATKGLIRKVDELKYKVENWDLIVVHVLQERLNAKYLDKWHGVRAGDENPKIEMMTKFLDDAATLLENQHTMRISVSNEYAQQHQKDAAKSGGSGDSGRVFPCAVCQSTDHEAKDCGDFYPLIYGDRLELAKRNNMCHVCLKRGHHKKNCFSLDRCDEPVCRGKDARHHPLLCAAKSRTERVHNVYSSHNSYDKGRDQHRNRNGATSSRS